MTEDTGNDPPRLNPRPKRSAAATKNTLKSNEFASADVELSKPNAKWTEAEELALLHSLQTHKWQDWDAIKADSKLNRTSASIDKKYRKFSSKFFNAEKASDLQKELRALSIKKWEEYLELKKKPLKNNPEIVNSEVKVDKGESSVIEAVISTEEMSFEANENQSCGPDIDDLINNEIEENTQTENNEIAHVTESEVIATTITEETTEEPLKTEDIIPNEVIEESLPVTEDITSGDVESTVVGPSIDTILNEKDFLGDETMIEKSASESDILDEIVEVKQEDMSVYSNDPEIADSIDHSNEDEIVQPIVDEIDQPIVDEIDQPTLDSIDHFNVDEIVQPILDEIDQPIVDEIDRPTIDEIVQPIVDKIDQPTVDSIDHSNVDGIAQPIVDSSVKDTLNDESQDMPNAEPQEIVPEILTPSNDIAAPIAPKKIGRKAKAQAPAKPAAKTPATAKSPPKSKPVAPTKRTYTRKTKNIVRPASVVSIGEEVSILSSSSDSFTKESINIMSSSSSEGRDSISSIPSIKSIDDSILSAESVQSAKSMESMESVNSVPSSSSAKKSKKKSPSETSSIKSGKSSKSAKSVKSTSSAKSVKSAKSAKSTSSTSSKSSVNSSKSKKSDDDEIVADWERKACPAIFNNSILKNPERNYKRLRTNAKNILIKNPGISDEAIKETVGKFTNDAIEQVLKILRTKKESEPTITSMTDDFELLKKMSTTSSGRKRKIRSEEGDWIDPNEVEGRVISHEPATPVKEKRKRKYVKKDLFTEDGVLSSTEDPFTLILLNDYTEHIGHSHFGSDLDLSHVKAPFKVEMCQSVIMLMDLHSHLHSSEIIGLLGGTFTTSKSSQERVLRIEFGYPCATAHSTGTQVDVDPLSEMEAGDYFERNGVRTAGWYHSHPNFEPNPSLRDLETQTIYQGLFRNSQPEIDSDVAPFVGVIVNPYLAVTESSSHVECFYVAPPAGLNQDRLPFRLPIDRFPFTPAAFPEILAKMREIVEKAGESPDRLDMQKNAEPGVKRIDKLLKSLQFHGDLTSEQLEEIKELLY